MRWPIHGLEKMRQGLRALRFRSLLPKIFLIIFVFILLPVLTFTVFANYITEESLMEQKRQSDLRTIHELAKNLDRLTDAVEDHGRLIACSDEAQSFFLRAASGEDRAAMDATGCQLRFAEALRDVAAVSFLDTRGRFIGERKLDKGRLSWYFNPTTLQRLSPAAAIWTDPFTIEFVDTRKQHRVIAAMVPSYRGQEHIGYVVAYMYADSIRALTLAYDEEITVLDAAECVVASRQRVPSYASLYQFKKIAYSLLIEDRSVIIPVDGQRQVVTTKGYPRMRFRLVMGSSFDSIANILNVHYYKLATGVGGSVLFALLAALLLARTFTRPVIRLRDVMAKGSGGDLSVRYRSRGVDEIEQLGSDFNHFMDTIQRLMAQRIDDEKQRRELQLQLLQEQVQPHFLYNVLEMISSLIQCNMTQEALGAIQALASFYRVSLSRGSDVISIRQEISLSESYLQLQKMRYVEYIDYMLAIDPLIFTCYIPKLTLQPLIENAIYHGLKGRRTKGIVSVSGSLSGDQVVFEVYDNGVGMSPKRLAELRAMVENADGEDAPVQHFGLVSVIKRLNSYCDQRALIQIDSEEGVYTSVRIAIPAVYSDRPKEAQESC